MISPAELISNDRSIRSDPSYEGCGIHLKPETFSCRENRAWEEPILTRFTFGALTLCTLAVTGASAQENGETRRQEDYCAQISVITSERIEGEENGDTPTDGYVARTGNVLMIDGPLSTGVGSIFELKLNEAVVFAGEDVPVILVLNSRGGQPAEAGRIAKAIALYRKSGVVFEGRVNCGHKCTQLCGDILAMTDRRQKNVRLAVEAPARSH